MGLDGGLLKDLTGLVISTATPTTFKFQTSRFGELRALFTTTGGTFGIIYRWLEHETAVGYLGETIVATDGDVDPVMAPWVELRLTATTSDVTITRGSVYGAGSPDN